jgi:16S rRNA (guanine527-N7)-methyltransferase
VDPRVATRLAEVAGPRAGQAAAALEVLVHELCTTPIGVTAIREPEVAWERHVLDALRAVEELDACPDGPLVDVGSGGGIPGLVLGVVRPERDLHLVEATTRKATFLRETAARIGVSATVHAERSEQLARVGGPLRDACACACARALAAPPAAAELCLPLVAPGGRVILWLGQSAVPADVSRAADELAGRVWPSHTPGLLVIEKLADTPPRFPRRPGVAAHRPLR